jgi:hypothetical protein
VITFRFTGLLCETRIYNNPCDSNPCFRGVCSSNLTSDYDYICLCPLDYTGLNCETRVSTSTTTTTTTITTTTTNVKQFKKKISLEINECSSNPCINNGICKLNEKVNNSSGFTCFCPPGFIGNLCELEFMLPQNGICSLLSPCKHGRCLPKGTTYKCICDQKWTGKNCDNVDFCFQSPCINNGICSQIKDDYECICPKNFEGKK